jgi:hypothetical protein
MKKILTHLLAVAACALWASSASGAIATLNFDTGPSNTVAYSGSTPYSFNNYTGYRSAVLRTVTPVSGASAVSGVGNGGGKALSFTTPGSGTKRTVSGSKFTLQLTASGNVTIREIKFDYNSNIAGSIAWTYAITGGGTGSATAIALGSAGAWLTTGQANFATINLTTGQIITFTATLTGQSRNRGERVSFDNIVVTSVPEPTNYALAGFGLIFINQHGGAFLCPPPFPRRPLTTAR